MRTQEGADSDEIDLLSYWRILVKRRWTVLGAAIIFGSNVYIARRAAQLARKAVTDPEINPEPPSPR